MFAYHLGKTMVSSSPLSPSLFFLSFLCITFFFISSVTFTSSLSFIHSPYSIFFCIHLNSSVPLLSSTFVAKVLDTAGTSSPDWHARWPTDVIGSADVPMLSAYVITIIISIITVIIIMNRRGRGVVVGSMLVW